MQVSAAHALLVVIIDNLINGVLQLVSDMLAQRLSQLLHRLADPLQLHLDVLNRLFDARTFLEHRLVLKLRILIIFLQTIGLGASIMVQLMKVYQTTKLVLK